MDSLEKLREEVARQGLEIAIIKTKVAIVSAGIGLVSGLIGSIISGSVVYLLKH